MEELDLGPLAHLVEQDTLNVKVAGPIPAWPIFSFLESDEEV